MQVVDTSIWIEWLTASEMLADIKNFFPSQEECVVPTIVQLELAKWLKREMGEDHADRVIAYTQKCVVASLDTDIALLAAEMHAIHKLATADAVVYATAQKYSARLLTCDAHFKNLPEVDYLVK
jgi:predicted nucleic acid-binding protein